MTRHLASARKISRLDPIPKADRIECAHMGGWPVVVRKDEFRPGDLCVYFEPDSMLPLSNPEFSKLGKSSKHEDNSAGEPCVVLRTNRIRGQISQGLAVRPEALGLGSIIEGEDLSDRLHIEKYDPPEAPTVGNMRRKPFFLIRTDEERVQNLTEMVEWLDAHPHAAFMYRASEKIDGTSTSYYRTVDDDGTVRYGACSNDHEIIRGGDDLYWRNYDANNVRSLLDGIAQESGGRTIIIQGESTGPKINGNRLGLKALSFFIFNVLVDGVRNDPHDMDILAGHTVPALDLELTSGMDEVIGQAYGLKSLVRPDRLAEGIVWRFDGPAPGDGFRSEWSHFKVLNNKYLLKLK